MEFLVGRDGNISCRLNHDVILWVDIFFSHGINFELFNFLPSSSMVDGYEEVCWGKTIEGIGSRRRGRIVAASGRRLKMACQEQIKLNLVSVITSMHASIHVNVHSRRRRPPS